MRKPMLVLAWGNPSRRDDGLGWVFAKTLLGHAAPSLEIDVDYQLQVEHAARLAESRGVLFVDAATTGPSPYDLHRLAPRHHRGFSSHHVPPEELLGLGIELFGQLPPAWLLAIRGYEFSEFGERLSEPARRNLERTVEDAVPALLEDRLDVLAASLTPHSRAIAER